MQFDTYVIGGVERVSIPSNAGWIYRSHMLDIYRPHNRLAKIGWFAIRHMPFAKNLNPLVIQTTGPSHRLENFKWQGWLSDIASRLNLDVKNLSCVFYFPPQLSRLKCAIRIHDQLSNIAFAKIAWGETEKGELLQEQYALEFCAKKRFRKFLTPKLLFADTYDNHQYVLCSTLPPKSRNAPHIWGEKYHTVWKELANSAARETVLEKLAWWQRSVELPPSWTLIRTYLIQQNKVRSYDVCPNHGDFTPWNARISGNQIVLFDWENFESSAPRYLDPIYFIISTMFYLENCRDHLAILSRMSTILMYDLGENKHIDILLALVYLKIFVKDPLLSQAIDCLASSLYNDVTTVESL